MEHMSEGCQCEGKLCNGCKEKLCVGAFYRRKKNNSLFPRCKECDARRNQERYQSNREQGIQRVREYRQRTGYDKKYYREHADHLRENTRLYYRSHHDEIRAKASLRERAYAERRKVYRQTHPENSKAYERAYRERRNELARIRRQRNPESRRAYQREYYRLHPERMKMRRQNYYQKRGRDYFREKYSDPGWRNRKQLLQRVYRDRPDIRERDAARHKAYHSRSDIRERWRVHASTRRARKSAVLGSYTPQQIQELLRRQRYCCYYCSRHFEKCKGKYIYHIDHTYPLSRVTGTSIPANDISYLVLACPRCNVSKGDKFPWEWPEGGKLL